jgi:hypothetical protein
MQQRTPTDNLQLTANRRIRPSTDLQFHLITTDGQSANPSWCRHPFVAHDQILIILRLAVTLFLSM